MQRLLKSLVASALLVLVTGSFSFFMINTSHQYAITRIDEAITDINNQMKSSEGDSLSNLLSLASESKVRFSVALVPADGELTVLLDSDASLNRTLTSQESALVSNSTASLNLGTNNRVRAFSLGGGDYALVAASTEEADRNQQQSLRFLALFEALLFALTLAISGYILKTRSLRISAALVNQETSSRERMQRFLGDAAHELRTPLTVIRGYNELLSKETHLAEQGRTKFQERISVEVKRMEALVSDLLLLAELGEKNSVENEIIDLHKMIEGFIEDLAILEPTRSVTFLGSTPTNIHGSRTLISQLLSNIFSNARRHTSPDASISLKLKTDATGTTLIYEDTGPGLPVEVLASLEGEFIRFNTGRSRSAGGSGLGLSIMKSIMDAHSGKIQFTNGIENGLILKVTFPTLGKN
ncbi:MAG: ATP-binding protein [Actinobacteria bacterium]|nr:ATP-binding protein [Actinomycetota bacterium]